MEGVGDTQHWHPLASQLVPLSEGVAVLLADCGSCHAYGLPLQVWALKGGISWAEGRSSRMKADCVHHFFGNWFGGGFMLCNLALLS